MSPEASQPNLDERERWGRNIVRYDIVLDGQRIGTFELLYKPKNKEVLIDAVELKPDYRGKGYAKQMYEQVHSLPLPDGSDFLENGYTFVSSDMLTPGSISVWESLVNDGKATKLDDGSYRYLEPKSD